jgi:hypothetical protein
LAPPLVPDPSIQNDHFCFVGKAEGKFVMDGESDKDGDTEGERVLLGSYDNEGV